MSAERAGAHPTHSSNLGWRVDQLAQITGLSRSLIFNAIKQGRLTAIKFGKRALFVPRESWDAYCRKHAVTSLDAEQEAR